MKPFFIQYWVLLLICCTHKPEQAKTVKMKCIGFRTSTVVPVYEDAFDKKEKSNTFFLTEKTILNLDSIRNGLEVLSAVAQQRPVSLDDYSIRASIKFDADVVFYFNWDRRHLIYQKKIYRISAEQMSRLTNLFNLCQ
ncbi:hypothetical protein ACWKW6_12230 [Dyadobacter jiangsuensis]